MKMQSTLWSHPLVLGALIYFFASGSCSPRRLPPSTRVINHTQNTTYVDGILTSALPRPFQGVAGTWKFDLTSPQGNVTSFSGETDLNGRYDALGARLNAVWDVDVFWTPPCLDSIHFIPPKPIPHSSATLNLTTDHFEVVWECKTQFFTKAGNPQFALDTNYPSTLNVQSDNQLSSQYGMPSLYTYSRSGDLVTSSTALAMATDGMSAIFPYPRKSDGSQLDPDFYSYAITNATSGGPAYADAGWFALGHKDMSYPHAFGVDGVSTQNTFTSWSAPDIYNDGTCAGFYTSESWSSESHFPAVTLYDSALLTWGSPTSTIGVGLRPTVVHVFNYQTTYDSGGGTCDGWYSETYQPLNAIVVNSGSDSVSFVNLISSTAISITVGHQPTDAAVLADGSKAYVTNYGDGTVSEVDLSQNGQTRVVSVGIQPSTISLDASGHAWVGGNGFVAKLDLASMTLLEYRPVTGRVTGLAVSGGQDQLVTVLDPSSTQNATATSAYRTDSQFASTYSAASSTAASDYLSSSLRPNLLLPAQLGSGALVSESVNNAFSISAQGTQFSVIDLSTGSVVMSGILDAPIRSFAVEPGAGIAYLTVPDSNSVISVPIPGLPPAN